MNHAELINLTNRLTQAKPASRKLIKYNTNNTNLL